MYQFLTDNLPKPQLVIAMWVFILIAVFIDLAAGVYKARSLNYLITSDGLKRTVTKMVLYFSLMAYACMMDIALSGAEWEVFKVPVVSIILCVLVLFIEGKSVLERANEKERKRLMNGAKDVTAILSSKEDIAKAVHDYLNDKKENQDGES